MKQYILSTSLLPFIAFGAIWDDIFTATLPIEDIATDVANILEYVDDIPTIYGYVDDIPRVITNLTNLLNVLELGFSSLSSDLNIKYSDRTMYLNGEFSDLSQDILQDLSSKYSSRSAYLDSKFNLASSDRENKFNIHSTDINNKYNSRTSYLDNKFTLSSNDRQNKYNERSVYLDNKFVNRTKYLNNEFNEGMIDRENKFNSLTNNLIKLQETVDSLPNLNGIQNGNGNRNDNSNANSVFSVMMNGTPQKGVVNIKMNVSDLCVIGAVVVGLNAIVTVILAMLIVKWCKRGNSTYHQPQKYNNDDTETEIENN
eukprot:79976_1